jgi:serine/threonine protein phosphatase PrpC
VTGTDVQEGDVMVLATDGIDSGFARSITPGGSAQAIADRILARHAKERDDALVVVVRYLPS